MALFAWKDAYSVQNTTLDAQHKKLIDLINRLHEAMKAGSGRTVIGGVLTELISYTNTHFGDEERRMLACSYGGYAAHKQARDAFAMKARELLEQYRSGSLTLSQNVLRLLKDWLVDHIEKMDQAYVPALLGKAAA